MFGLVRAAKVAAFNVQEIKMKLIARFELAAKNENELYALLSDCFNNLARSDADTHQRRNALASIENIQREIASRAPCP